MFIVENHAMLEAVARTVECQENDFNLLIVLYLHYCT